MNKIIQNSLSSQEKPKTNKTKESTDSFTKRQEMAYQERIDINKIGYQYDCDAQLLSMEKCVDYGILCLKTLIILNGGAAIALLTFIGNVWKSGDKVAITQVSQIMDSYLSGLVFAMLSMGFSYFAQRFYTGLFGVSLGKIEPKNIIKRLLKWVSNNKFLTFAHMLSLSGILFAIASLCLFVKGSKLAAVSFGNITPPTVPQVQVTHPTNNVQGGEALGTIAPIALLPVDEVLGTVGKN